MIELEAKSVDTAASDCWTTMSRNVTKGGGWKRTGESRLRGVWRRGIEGRRERGKEGITNRDRRSMIQITAPVPRITPANLSAMATGEGGREGERANALRTIHDRKLSRCSLTCQVGKKKEEVDKLHGCCFLRTQLALASRQTTKCT